MLTTVTFTGADDSVNPRTLCALSEEYSFVEWGILFSQRHQGSYRYPSVEWMQDLHEVMPITAKLSAHLCGWWVRDIMQYGNFAWYQQYDWPEMFGRLQLNFHAERLYSTSGIDTIFRSDAWQKPVILQCDGVNDGLAQDIASAWPRRVQPLFDTSGGAGVLPQSWPRPWSGTVSGYAGGLGPATIAVELPKIIEAAGGSDYWIDMERRVRSADDSTFDLSKVQDVCSMIVKDFPHLIK